MPSGQGSADVTRVPPHAPRRTRRAALAALIALTLCASPSLAQGGTEGAVAGRLLQTSGLPAAHVRIAVRAEDTGLMEEITTGAHGDFNLVHLPPASYRLSVTTETSTTVPLPDTIEVRAGEVLQMPLRLIRSHGSTGALLLIAASAELPAEPSTMQQANAQQAGDSDSESYVFRGLDPTQNNNRVDGVSAEESFGGERLGAGVQEDADGATDTPRDGTAGPGSGWSSVEDGGRRSGAAYIFAQAAVREFRVNGQSDAATYGSALYGHGVGGVISTATRSGELHLHGMIFYTARASAWAAANPFDIATSYNNGAITSAVVKPQDLRQQFGGRIGGPILWSHAAHSQGASGSPSRPLTASSYSGMGQSLAQPRWFYLFAFDAQPRDFPAVSSPGYAAFYGLTSTQTALLQTRGVSSAQTRAALNYLSGLTGTVTRRSNDVVNFGRIDWQRRSNDRVVAEFNDARWSNPAGARSNAVVNRGLASIGSSFGAVDMAVGRWVRFLGAAFSNEVRVQYGRELQYETPQQPLAQEPNIGPGDLPPEISIGPQGLVFGTPAALGQHAYPDEHRLELAEIATWVHGRSVLQLGGDVSAISDFTDSLTNAEGTFSYDSGTTGGSAGGLVDWITDYTYNVHAYPNGACPSIRAAAHDFCFRSYSQSFGTQSVRFTRQEWAGFVQEDWRLLPALTVHAGVRYEYEFLPLPQNPNAAIDAVFGTRGATSIFPEDRNNVGPRVGLEWQPLGQGRGVVRAGYGVYYGRLPGATLQAALLDTAGAGGVSRVRILPTTETTCPQAAGVGFGYACSYLAEPAGVVASTTSAVVFDRRFRLPMVQQGTLSLERSLGAGLLARASYVTNYDRQLPNSSDLNIAPSTGTKVFQLQGGAGQIGVQDGETFAVPVYTARASASFGPVTDVVSNVDATYQGLTLEARRGFGAVRPGRAARTQGLEFRLAWTWAKAIDFGQTAGATPRQNGQFDPFNVRYDKGLSALNFPHRIVGTVVWSPVPGWAQETHFGRALVRNWSVASVFTESSGRGYSYEIFGGTRLPGGHETINGSGGSTVLPTVGRNTLRLPDSENLDLRLSRAWHMGDRIRMSGSAEAFNLANHVNITGVQQRAFLVGTPANGVTPLVFQDAATVASEGLNVQPFGTFTSSSSSQMRERQLEFAVRLEF